MPEISVAAWCAHTRNAFRDWEEHEMGAFPDESARDLGIVEWVVRVLGNPEVSDSRAVIEVLLARHHNRAVPDLDLSISREDHAAYRSLRDDPDSQVDYIAVVEAAANHIPALTAEVERLRDERDQALAQRDDATNRLADIERASDGEAAP